MTISLEAGPLVSVTRRELGVTDVIHLSIKFVWSVIGPVAVSYDRPQGYTTSVLMAGASSGDVI